MTDTATGVATNHEIVHGYLAEQGLDSYVDHGSAVVERLNTKDADIAEYLVGVAVDKGLSQADARELMYSAGLVARPVPVASTPQVAESNGSDLEGRIANLERIARARGLL